jgi:PTS system mannose-specific IID component
MSEPVRLTKGDLVSIFWRSSFEQGSWNYERMQNLGFAYIMVPAIKRLYDQPKDQQAVMQRHLAFFNTMPYMQSTITGVVLSMEEQRANGGLIEAEDINNVKVGMMGPLAGVGDPVWWSTIRPVLAAFAVGLANSQVGIVGPLLFFIVWNALRLGFRGYTQMLGYHSGLNITQYLSGNLLPRLTQGASILGMFIMGAVVPRWTVINFPTIVGSGRSGVSMQYVLNQILPGLVPLLLTLGCLWLIRKRVNPIWLMIGLFVIGFLGYWSGILGL